MKECFNAEFARNIALECDTKITGGYRGRAVYIPYRSVNALTIDAENSAILKAVTLKESAKCVAINNASASQPMSGSTTTGSNENGYVTYAKTVNITIPLRGADVSKDTIEPLVNDPEGGLLIVEKNDKRGLGSFEVFGLKTAAKVDPTTISRDEYANGGAWSMSIGCTEHDAECSFFATDYETTKAAFDELYYVKSF